MCRAFEFTQSLWWRVHTDSMAKVSPHGYFVGLPLLECITVPISCEQVRRFIVPGASPFIWSEDCVCVLRFMWYDTNSKLILQRYHLLEFIWFIWYGANICDTELNMYLVFMRDLSNVRSPNVSYVGNYSISTVIHRKHCGIFLVILRILNSPSF